MFELLAFYITVYAMILLVIGFMAGFAEAGSVTPEDVALLMLVSLAWPLIVFVLIGGSMGELLRKRKEQQGL